MFTIRRLDIQYSFKFVIYNKNILQLATDFYVMEI